MNATEQREPVFVILPFNVEGHRRDGVLNIDRVEAMTTRELNSWDGHLTEIHMISGKVHHVPLKMSEVIRRMAEAEGHRV